VIAAIAVALGHQLPASSSSTVLSSAIVTTLVGAPRNEIPDLGRGRRALGEADSGWRSRAYQKQLLQQAIAKYGSEAEAARWVATPSTSAHVAGEAVDIGHADAAAWLSRHGAAYGLCQIYGNEPWHYELRPADNRCPAMYADPTQDPRMWR
jgi:D-alanyl-D-alanine carboxypeptidase